MKFLAAMLLAATAAASAAADDGWDARLGRVDGRVKIIAGDAVDGEGAAACEAGLPLEQGDRIQVGRGGSAEVVLDGRSVIALDENSDFTLTALSRARSRFTLALGSLLAKIQKLGEQRLSVRAPAAVAAVRGTEFGVSVAADNAADVGVFEEGRVEVRGADGGLVVLGPGQESRAAFGAEPGRAARLTVFSRRRAAMRALVKRLARITKNWKSLSPDERAGLRRDELTRLRAEEARLEAAESRRAQGRSSVQRRLDRREDRH